MDPLVHLIRNAIDHGIETPERRVSSGKPPVGKLLLSASHEGSFVSIRVSDDGAGLDYDAIRERAIERGLIAPDAVLSEQQTAALVLNPASRPRRRSPKSPAAAWAQTSCSGAWKRCAAPYPCKAYAERARQWACAFPSRSQSSTDCWWKLDSTAS